MLSDILNILKKLKFSSYSLDARLRERYCGSITLASSSARTSSGSGSDVDLSMYYEGNIFIDVTAVSGTNPILNIYLEEKNQGSNKYRTLWSKLNINAVGTYFNDTPIKLLSKNYRVRWEISGTSPSFTFAVYMDVKT